MDGLRPPHKHSIFGDRISGAIRSVTESFNGLVRGPAQPGQPEQSSPLKRTRTNEAEPNPSPNPKRPRRSSPAKAPAGLRDVYASRVRRTESVKSAVSRLFYVDFYHRNVDLVRILRIARLLAHEAVWHRLPLLQTRIEVH